MFAAASATSVADHLQHETGTPHEHGAHLTLAPIDDHAAAHAGSHGDEDERAAQDDDDASDPQPSTGHHHHADAPVGAPGSSVTIAVVAPGDAATGGDPAEANPKGVRPGGLERPPRPIAILV